MANKFVQTYLREIEQIHARGNATEHSYRGALQRLTDALNPKVRAVNEPKRVNVGAPDYIIMEGETPLGYIEAKDIGVDLDGKDTQKQLARYVDGLGNVILTDYLEFRWYVNDSKSYRHSIRLATPKGKKFVYEDNDEKFIALFEQFLGSPASTVKSAKELALRMAKLADIIRDIILNAINEGESTQLNDTMKSFREVLLHDMTDHQFADMYAQTISYGMFAARVNHTDKKKKFERMTAGYDLPKTNPFLRQLFNTIGGPELDERVTWAVDELANLLRHTAMEDILRDFGTRTRQEDPVVHFYETFLAAYDPKLRESRGVYYTPEPVVSYIVRSVDHILKTDFGLEKGLADSSKIKTPPPMSEAKRRGLGGGQAAEPQSGRSGDRTTPQPPPLAEEGELLHKVLILDPACGTGTFLHGVIDQIHENFKSNEGAWSSYVSEHLLPRIFGFELLMAPYAVAHLKLGLQLKEYGYDFKSDERLRVYLTNTLEEAFTADERLPFSNYLAKEANAANEVKRDLPIMVVLGNPPYSGHSANASWKEVINPKTGKAKKEATWIGELIQDYYYVDGKPLGEKNPKWLQDDYVKFIRFAQWRIEQTGSGVLAFISNHGYLDNPTFRGMRQSLMKTFDDIYILDLHGNSKKKEKSPDGSKDENVFDIQQGVAIGIFVKKKIEKKKDAVVRHGHLYGEREAKYGLLLDKQIEDTKWNILNPSIPFYLFASESEGLKDEYSSFFEVQKIMSTNVLGFQTHRDDFAIDFEKQIIEKRFDEFRSTLSTDAEIIRKYDLKDNRDWNVKSSRASIQKVASWKDAITKCLYRPFDERWCYFSTIAMDYPRRELLDNVVHRDNICLGLGRQGLAVQDPIWSLISVSRVPVDANIFRRGGINIFPLYLYPDGKKDLFSSESTPDPTLREPNLSPKFIAEFSERLNLKFIPDGKGNLNKTFGPEDVFHYMYAVFHSPAYRSRYAEFLKIDFPRLPLTSDLSLFTKLCKLGEELVKLHLMVKFGKPLTGFRGKGSDMVEYVKYEPESAPGSARTTRGVVQINEDQYFEGIPDAVWNFHIGGYQVAQKWLKDRKNRKLSYDDIEHYHHIISALSETTRLMQEIDEVISEAGGFPLK